MKMETVIRSPQDGVIKKLAHKEGVSRSGPHIHESYANDILGYLQGWYCTCLV